jgi:hypothetical protein
VVSRGQWGAEWLRVQEGGVYRVPALDWLLEQPENVQDTMLAIVQGVRAGGPDSWFDPTHVAMSGPVAHLHEARDKHDQTLYRLFLLWQRDERRVVFIDGRTKPNNTALHPSEYETIAALTEHVYDDQPFMTVDEAVERLRRAKRND